MKTLKIILCLFLPQLCSCLQILDVESDVIGSSWDTRLAKYDESENGYGDPIPKRSGYWFGGSSQFNIYNNAPEIDDGSLKVLLRGFVNGSATSFLAIVVRFGGSRIYEVNFDPRNKWEEEIFIFKDLPPEDVTINVWGSGTTRTDFAIVDRVQICALSEECRKVDDPANPITTTTTSTTESTTTTTTTTVPKTTTISSTTTESTTSTATTTTTIPTTSTTTTVPPTTTEPTTSSATSTTIPTTSKATTTPIYTTSTTTGSTTPTQSTPRPTTLQTTRIPTMRPGPGSDSDSTRTVLIAILSGVGGLLLLAAVLFVLIIATRRTRRERHNDRVAQYPYYSNYSDYSRSLYSANTDYNHGNSSVIIPKAKSPYFGAPLPSNYVYNYNGRNYQQF